MQIAYQHKGLYQLNLGNGIVDSKEVLERQQKIDLIEKLKNEGCSDEVTFEAANVSRPTYYRWKKNVKIYGTEGLESASKRPNRVRKSLVTVEMKERILALRRKYPFFGKQKIAVMYKKQYGEELSESTIGRVISKFIKDAVILPVAAIIGKKTSRRRLFHGHAQRITDKQQAHNPGELVQIDHMTLHEENMPHVKCFSARCPITKYDAHKVYKRASSSDAKDFLDTVLATFPFKVKSIQVDGGVEFMAEFEKACQEKKIPLYVLPPRSPKMNGCVERANGTVKYEFFGLYTGKSSLDKLQKKLDKYNYFYNFVRPHQGIGLLTPHEFYSTLKRE